MADYICTKCDYVGERKRRKPGSTAIEIFLWVALLIPGPFYTIWRILGKRMACPKCGTTKMVPVKAKEDELSQEELAKEVADENLKDIPSILTNDKRKYKIENNTKIKDNLKTEIEFNDKDLHVKVKKESEDKSVEIENKKDYDNKNDDW